MYSCEVLVKFDTDTHIVVQSYFTDNDKDLIVYVAKSNNRTDNSTDYVENATVTLYDSDDIDSGIFLVLTVGADEIFYKTIGFQPIIGKEYLLTVDVTGYDQITAVNSIPKRVNLSDAEIGNSVSTNDVGVSTIDFEVTVKIDDPVDNQNFYHILFSQELIQEKEINGVIVTDTVIINDENLIIDIIAKNLSIDKIHDKPNFIINDDGFNGEQLVINFEGRFDYDPSRYERGEFIIEMRSVSHEYYNHYLNIVNQPAGNSLHGSDIIYGNIINGVGVFAGYSFQFQSLAFT